MKSWHLEKFRLTISFQACDNKLVLLPLEKKKTKYLIRKDNASTGATQPTKEKNKSLSLCVSTGKN